VRDRIKAILSDPKRKEIAMLKQSISKKDMALDRKDTEIAKKDREIASLQESLNKSKPIDVVDMIDNTSSKRPRTEDASKSTLAFQHEQNQKIVKIKEEKIVRVEKRVVESNLIEARADLEDVRGQKEAAEAGLKNIRARIDDANRMPKVISFQLKYEHTHCGTCLTKFSADTDSKDEEIRKFLPVLSASKTCDHYFCHGCVLKRQATLAEEDDKVRKWIQCMHCRTITSFCPSEPKYHRLLIDILKQAKWTAPQIKEEPNE